MISRAVIPSAARDLQLLSAGLLIAAAAPALAQQPADFHVQLGVQVSSDTVTVGQHFDVRVRVRAPADAEIRFPENPDSTGAVQSRDPRSIETLDSLRALDEVATYHVAAWNIGLQPILLSDAVVTWQGSDHPVTLGDIRVFVRSVLPADSAQRVPKPARALWEPRAFPWWLVALIAAALLIALGIWWWLRRRRRPPAPVVIDPWARAQREFTRIEAMGLIEASERTRFVALVVEVLRDYLAARYPDASLALTSRELVVLLRRQPHVPVERLSRVLHEADLAKFAAWTLSEERARSLGREAREIVAHEHKAWKASLTPTEAAA